MDVRTHNVQLERNFCGEHHRHLLYELHRLQPEMLWIRVTGTKTIRGDRHDQRQSRALEALARLQLDEGRHLVIEGSDGDNVWDLEGHQRLAADERLTPT